MRRDGNAESVNPQKAARIVEFQKRFQITVAHLGRMAQSVTCGTLAHSHENRIQLVPEGTDRSIGVFLPD